MLVMTDEPARVPKYLPLTRRRKESRMDLRSLRISKSLDEVASLSQIEI